MLRGWWHVLPSPKEEPVKKLIVTACLGALLAATFACEDNKTTEGAASATATSTTKATAPATTAEAPAAPKADSEKTVVDVAVGSKDHSTLVAAVKQAELVEVLASPGGVYTVFAPTNAAFDKLPKGTVDDLMKPENKAKLKTILQHHAGVPIVETKDMKDGQQMAMSDGTKVTFHVKDGKVSVDGANIVASIKCMNGVVHVVDAVVLPPPPK